MKQDPKRATGRTLGLALQAIGKAVENPGTEVEFINHNPQNHAQHQMCKKQIELLAKQLHLDVTVKVCHYAYGPEKEDKLFIKSNWISPYSQSREAEEKWKEIYGSCPNKQCTSWQYFLQGFEASK
jgi:hypothetical protein